MKGFSISTTMGAAVVFLTLMTSNVSSQTRPLTAFPDVSFNTPYIESRYGPASLATGYYESLPLSYSSTTQKYPVIIFLHGYGEVGNGSATDLLRLRNSGGLMTYLRNGTFPETFTVGGNTYSFIVIAPQFQRPPDINPWNGSATMNSVVNYVLANYPRADPTRIYVTGLSAGGGLAWYGAGRFKEDGERLAAVVTAAGAASYPEWARNIGFAKLPMWSLVNADDELFYYNTPEWVDEANSVSNPDVAKKTIFPSGGHDVWTKVYNPTFREGGLSIYEWMLTNQRIGDIVLPVTLGAYNASVITPGNNGTQKVLVNWATTLEQNNSFFTVSRSADGINFTTVGKIPAGAQRQGNSYTFTDQSPLIGVSYYRLSQTDVDGSTKSFDIKQVTIGSSLDDNMARIYPNPASDQVVLEINNKVTGKLTATIVNAEGKVLFTKVFSKPSGFAREVINIGSLAKGLYILKVNGDSYLSTLRFIKE